MTTLLLQRSAARGGAMVGTLIDCYDDTAATLGGAMLGATKAKRAALIGGDRMQP